MKKEPVQPPDLPVLGIYTPAWKVSGGQVILCSGLVGVDQDGELAGVDDAAAQTRQALRNLQLVLETAGATMDDVVALRVFSTDMGNRQAINSVRREFFSEPFPASTHVEISRLVGEDWLVEIEATAVIGEA